MNKFLNILSVLLFLSACQATQDALTLKKKNNADEFLVEKKSPLVLPPNFGELPTPNEENVNEKNKDNNDIKVTLDTEKVEIDVPIKNSNPTPLEESVLEKIK